MDGRGPAGRQLLAGAMNAIPYAICPSEMSDHRRPRYCFFNWPVSSTPEIALIDGWEVRGLHFQPLQALPDCSLENGARRVPGFEGTPLATFVRPTPRSRPGDSPRGLECCSDMALQRWKADMYRYAPYQYEDWSCVIEGQTFRLLNANERESSLGFKVAHTLPCVPKKQRSYQKISLEDQRNRLLGNSFSCLVVACLVGQCLHHCGILELPPTLESCWGHTVQEELFDRPPLLAAGVADLEEVSLEQEATAQLHRAAIYKGSDVRLTEGVLLSPSQWPRQAIDVHRWFWKVCMSYEKDGAHINALELNAILAAHRCRSRSARRI